MFESLSQVAHWPVRPLSDGLRINKVCRFSIDDLTEYRVVGVTNRGGGIGIKRVVRGSDLTMREYQRVSENQLMWCKVDTKNGAFGVTRHVHNGCIASQNMCLADIDSSVLDPQFLQFFFQIPSVVDGITAASLGTTNRQYLKPQEFLGNVRLRLPPLTEQRRMVARIEVLAAQIREARELRQEAADEVGMLVPSHVSQYFVEGPRHGWSSGVLGDYITSDCYGTSEKASDDSSGIPILRMGNIQDGRISFRDLKYLHLSERDRARLLLQRDDILVNRTNSAELVGKCAVFHSDDEFSFASYLIRLRLDTTRTDPRLVAAYINSPLGRAYMVSEKKQMTGQANVNATKLRALPIALPPLPEQQRVVAELGALLSQVESLKRIQAETTAELDALLPAVLDRAFKGELV